MTRIVERKIDYAKRSEEVIEHHTIADKTSPRLEHHVEMLVTYGNGASNSIHYPLRSGLIDVVYENPIHVTRRSRSGSCCHNVNVLCAIGLNQVTAIRRSVAGDGD